MKNMYKLPVLCMCLLFAAFQLNAQDNKTIIQNYIAANAADLELNAALVDFDISSATTLSDKETKVVYLQQKVGDVKIASTSATVLIKDGAVTYFKHTFDSSFATSIQPGVATISATDAVSQAVSQMGLSGVSGVKASNYATAEDELVTNLSSGFTSPLTYVEDSNGSHVLAYEVIVKEPSSSWWFAKINAVDGQLINRSDLNLSCNFDAVLATDENPNEHSFHSHTTVRNGQSILIDAKKKNTKLNAENLVADGAIYNAFPLRVESPIHGVGNGDEEGEKRVFLSEPSITGSALEPSPHGWHDVDNNAGAEFTTTQGNNVFAYLDVFEQDSPSAPDGVSPTVDGGDALFFDNPLDLSLQPTGYYDAAVTNLFVWNNFVHDVWYNYGFDETSGNFQENSYDRETADENSLLFGYGGDSVNAEAQDESQTATPASNNANMGTSFDGSNPRMQMYLWGAPPFGEFFEVYNTTGENADVVKVYFSSRFPFADVPRNDDGSPMGEARANLVVVMDDMTPSGMEDGSTPGESTDPEDGCTDYLNGDAIDGNIAVVRRGVCSFATKIRRAQNAGAIAVVMVNNNEAMGDEVISGGGTPDEPITIPAVFISFNNGDPLIAELNGGAEIEAEIVDNSPPAVMKDGDLDQGIIAHEYGHGISTRLTGGRARFDCLISAMEAGGEQMGEGWSDWFALVMTQELDDTAEQPRGIGTYVLGQDALGSGIRPARYSTDFAVNDYTYGDLPNDEISVPHGVGFVWSTILWDMYWDFIDEYGFDADMYNGTGGNNMAMRLVMDGLKIQTCEDVGFVEGRNAIIQADANIYDGANEMLIRTAFARRGVGFFAVQGSGQSRLDQVEDFNVTADDVLSTDDVTRTLFTVFPNPAKNRISINSNVNSGEATVEMFDINGRQVMTSKVDLANTANVTLNNMASGVYVIKISTASASHTQKLVIN